MKVLKKIGNVFCIVVIFCLVVFEILQFTHTIFICKVLTGSMEDSIRAGDYIVVKKEKNYKVGDVVTYLYDDYLITHRIVKIDGDKVITKGDANNLEDDAIKESDIMGKIIFKNDFLNFIIHFRWIFIIIAIVLFGISFIPFNEKNNDNEDEDESTDIESEEEEKEVEEVL